MAVVMKGNTLVEDITEPTFAPKPSLGASHGAVGFGTSENSLIR
jgi:hypothetical protein